MATPVGWETTPSWSPSTLIITFHYLLGNLIGNCQHSSLQNPRKCPSGKLLAAIRKMIRREKMDKFNN